MRRELPAVVARLRSRRITRGLPIIHTSRPRYRLVAWERQVRPGQPVLQDQRAVQARPGRPVQARLDRPALQAAVRLVRAGQGRPDQPVQARLDQRVRPGLAPLQRRRGIRLIFLVSPSVAAILLPRQRQVRPVYEEPTVKLRANLTGNIPTRQSTLMVWM